MLHGVALWGQIQGRDNPSLPLLPPLGVRRRVGGVGVFRYILGPPVLPSLLMHALRMAGGAPILGFSGDGGVRLWCIHTPSPNRRSHSCSPACSVLVGCLSLSPLAFSLSRQTLWWKMFHFTVRGQ
ncbi:hypothetical protein YC2023_037301 [Brassica napus]